MASKVLSAEEFNKMRHAYGFLLTVRQFADRAGVSTQAVHRALRTGAIPGAVKFGPVWSIPESAVRAWRPPKRGRPVKP
jgi:predicted DNA-binding transcriptional regulator AlpA